VKPLPYRQIARILRSHGCEHVRTHGSHHVWRCGTCSATIPAHKESSQVAPGTLRQIEAAMAPCLGEGWLSQ